MVDWCRMHKSIVIAKAILKKNLKSPAISIPLILFPIVELLLFGYMHLAEGFNGGGRGAQPFIFGTMLWISLYRSQIEINSVVFENIGMSNMKNIFSAPISAVEFINGVILSSVIKLIPTLIIFFVASEILFNFFFQQSMPVLGYAVINYMIFGWTVGVATSALAIIYGTKINFLTWFSTVLLYPFLSTYYQPANMGWPLSLIGKIMPTYPISVEYLQSQTISLASFALSLGINLIYLLLAYLLLVICFRIGLKRGVFYYQ